MDLKLAGKVALITGSCRGIGLATRMVEIIDYLYSFETS
jgi:NADP-dependent 3-hydroxy acid dehydrogenase YdfG